MRTFLIATLLLGAACSTATAPEDAPIPEDFPINIEDLAQFDEAAAEAVIGSVNPLENDLRGLEVAIRLHEGFQIKPEGAFFLLGLTDGDGIQQIDQEFTLVETFGLESPSLATEQRDEFLIRTFKLDPDDDDRMQANDALLQTYKQNSSGENELTFNAGAKTCAHPDIETPDQYRIAFFVRTAADVEFVPLSAGDLIVERENSGPFEFAWEPCDF